MQILRSNPRATESETLREEPSNLHFNTPCPPGNSEAAEVGEALLQGTLPLKARTPAGAGVVRMGEEDKLENYLES